MSHADDTHKSKCPGGNQGTRDDDTEPFYHFRPAIILERRVPDASGLDRSTEISDGA